MVKGATGSTNSVKRRPHPEAKKAPEKMRTLPELWQWPQCGSNKVVVDTASASSSMDAVSEDMVSPPPSSVTTFVAGMPATLSAEAQCLQAFSIPVAGVALVAHAACEGHGPHQASPQSDRPVFARASSVSSPTDAARAERESGAVEPQCVQEASNETRKDHDPDREIDDSKHSSLTPSLENLTD